MRLPILAFLLALALGGCDEAPNPVAPSGSVLTVTANPARITPTGQANLTITGFRPDGNRLNPGTQVRLTTSLGTLGSSLVEIGTDGLASTILTGDGRVGDATVKAQLTTSDTSAETVVKVDAPKPTLQVIPSRTEIDPSEVVPVTIIARDENSLPFGAGENILLTGTLGTFEKNGQEITAVNTESDGRARFDFVAGEVAGTAKITAILRNSDAATADLTIRDIAQEFVLVADRLEVALNEDVRLTVTVTNPAGRPAQGIFVAFRVEGAAGTFSPASGTTSREGVVTTTFRFTDSNLATGATFRLVAIVSIPGNDEKGVTITKR